MRSEPVIIDPMTFAGWDKLLSSQRGFSFFHSSGWARVLNASYRYTPKYFALMENGRFQALIPVMEVNSIITGKRGVSLPFTDYCEPIIAEEGLFRKLFNYIVAYGNKAGWRFVEFRGGRSFLQGSISSCMYSHTLELSEDENTIFQNFRSSTKRNIKKAMKEGVEVEISYSMQSLKHFYRLNRMTRKEHGLPPQPYRFFKSMFNEIINKNMGFVALAYYKKKIIAGAVCFQFGRTGIYKYGASDRRYQHLRGNNLVMWEAIKWHSRNGFKSFCFGRTEPRNRGLRQFKAGWGADERIINYYTYDLVKDAFITNSPKLNGLHNWFFRRMPTPVLQAVGTVMYRHMG